MPERRELEMLSAALQQGDWHVECQSAALAASPKKIEIIDFQLKKARLFLNLNLGENRERTLAVEIEKVNLDGRFGSPYYAEPRRFSISCSGFSEAKCKRVRAGIDGGYWRVIFPSGIGLVFVRDEQAPPGWPLFGASRSTYGFDEHVHRYGSGDNLLRTPRVAQSRALQVGDVLATGEHVLSLPRCGYNSSVLVHLTGGLNGHWIDIAPRLPIALLTQEDNAPLELWNRK